MLFLSIVTRVPCPFYPLPIKSSLHHFNPLYHYALSPHPWHPSVGAARSQASSEAGILWVQMGRRWAERRALSQVQSWDLGKGWKGERGEGCKQPSHLGLPLVCWLWGPWWHAGMSTFKLYSLWLRVWAQKHNSPKLTSVLVQLVLAITLGVFL